MSGCPTHAPLLRRLLGSDTNSGSESATDESDGESKDTDKRQEDDDDIVESSEDEAKAGDDNNNSDGEDADGEDEIIETPRDDGINETDKDEDNDDQGDDDDNGKDGAKNEDALAALYEYIKKLDGKVSNAKMTGAEIEMALGLKRTPNLRIQKEKAYFCSLKSDDMKYIKQLYKGDDSCEEVIADVIAEKQWLLPLVMLMQALNWSNSIDGLPDDNTIGDENLILLWNPGEEFVDTFMLQEDPDLLKMSPNAC